MEKLIKEYVDFLKGDGLASGKFWELEKKIKKDKKNPGVLLQDVRRSNFHMHLASLVGYEVISMKDLEGFSDETKEIVERMLRRLMMDKVENAIKRMFHWTNEVRKRKKSTIPNRDAPGES